MTDGPKRSEREPFVFSPYVLDKLAEMELKSDAYVAADLLAGALVWSDEMPEVLELPDRANLVAWRYLIVHRGALTRQKVESGDDSASWNQVVERVPSWPGLRPERRDARCRRLLRWMELRQDREFEQFEPLPEQDTDAVSPAVELLYASLDRETAETVREFGLEGALTDTQKKIYSPVSKYQFLEEVDLYVHIMRLLVDNPGLHPRVVRQSTNKFGRVPVWIALLQMRRCGWVMRTGGWFSGSHYSMTELGETIRRVLQCIQEHPELVVEGSPRATSNGT